MVIFVTKNGHRFHMTARQWQWPVINNRIKLTHIAPHVHHATTYTYISPFDILSVLSPPSLPLSAYLICNTPFTPLNTNPLEREGRFPRPTFPSSSPQPSPKNSQSPGDGNNLCTRVNCAKKKKKSRDFGKKGKKEEFSNRNEAKQLIR